MVDSLRDLKKSREMMFEHLNKQVEEDNKRGGGRPEADARFWYPETDAAGNGFAIIRFLSAPRGETVPYIREFSHGFKGPSGQYYIQKSRTTLKGPDGRFESDPVSEFNRDEWARADALKAEGKVAEAERIYAAVKNRKRNTSYICNILVVKDPKNPENEGKVFLFRYGIKIHNKITDKMKPAFEGDIPVNPYDFWEGCNFRLQITTGKPGPGQKKGFRNYDNSSFDSKSPIAGSDEAIEAIWLQEHPLQPLIAPDQFLSYEELDKMFKRVMTPPRSAGATAPAPSQQVASSQFRAEPEPERAPWEGGEETNDAPASEEDDLEYYRRLAAEAAS